MRMNFDPECAVAGSLIIACVVLFDSFHLLSEPDSKSSLKMVVAVTGGVMVTLAAPLVPPHDAVIVTVPATSALTSPDADTVAMEELLDTQVIVRPDKMLPFASRATAESCTVAPTAALGAAGDTVTVVTGTGAGAVAVTADVPFLPSLWAVIVALPAATAVTSPAEDTVAIVELLDDQVTVLPVRAFPFASAVAADS